MARLDEINDELTVAASLLGDAAVDIQNCGFGTEEHIRRIGDALGRVYEIQHAIYKERPDLVPAFLKKPEEISAHSAANSRLTEALANVYRFGELGQGSEAERELRAYITQETSDLHRRIAERILKRNLDAEGT